MQKFIAITALYALGIVIGILTMIHGYGVQPVSYGWIIGFGCLGRLMLEAMTDIMKEQK